MRRHLRQHLLDEECYMKRVHDFVEMIKNTEVQYDAVIGVGRGGLIPAVYVSHSLNIPMGTIMVNKYNGKSKVGGRVKVADSLSIMGADCNSRVLVIDDINDTGDTLGVLNQVLSHMFARVSFAVMFNKLTSKFIPDYYLETIDDVWIQFPYDKEDR